MGLPTFFVFAILSFCVALGAGCESCPRLVPRFCFRGWTVKSGTALSQWWPTLLRRLGAVAVCLSGCCNLRRLMSMTSGWCAMHVGLPAFRVPFFLCCVCVAWFCGFWAPFLLSRGQRPCHRWVVVCWGFFGKRQGQPPLPLWPAVFFRSLGCFSAPAGLPW